MKLTERVEVEEDYWVSRVFKTLSKIRKVCPNIINKAHINLIFKNYILSGPYLEKPVRFFIFQDMEHSYGMVNKYARKAIPMGTEHQSDGD